MRNCQWIKTSGWIAWLCLAAGIYAAETNTPPSKQLAASAAKWQEAKAACKGNYSYTVRFSSWTGLGNETIIVVRDNKVAERRFRSWDRSAPPAPADPGQGGTGAGGGKDAAWVETGGDLGKHPQGAPLKTLDQLYEEAKQAVANPDEPFHKLFLQFDKQGLLNNAFKVDTRIMDDSPKKGVSIENISLDTAKPRN